ncbi:MAG: 3-oxoacyl-[acyl-carrier-protein] reductase [Bdellovibrionales bacterium]|nr:3-oxoacyl-[acyl-carrier-protein] reductase [Oligoflexia bacterium]
MSEAKSTNETRTIAVVTGASRGIGSAIAEKLGSCGYHVIVNYLTNEAKAIEVVKRIEAAGGTAEAMRFDVSKDDEVSNAFDVIAKKGMPLSVLVNNAGISEDGLILRLKKESLDRTLQTNLVSAIFCSKEAARLMMKQRKGSIIQISSVVGEMGNGGQVAYAAAKAGMIGLTKSLAKEIASRHIRVNAVTPGYIETDMTDALNEAQKASIIEKIPLGTLGKVSDVAELVAFLASNASQYITGQVIGVNGGLYI